ncbi:MAG: hypothetical protein ACREMY_19855 [bacterium]
MEVQIDRINVVTGARTPDVLHVHIVCRCGAPDDDCHETEPHDNLTLTAASCSVCQH